ncbi:hypothetical protein VPH35_109732 [Triticum aestivum]
MPQVAEAVGRAIRVGSEARLLAGSGAGRRLGRDGQIRPTAEEHPWRHPWRLWVPRADKGCCLGSGQQPWRRALQESGVHRPCNACRRGRASLGDSGWRRGGAAVSEKGK